MKTSWQTAFRQTGPTSCMLVLMGLLSGACVTSPPPVAPAMDYDHFLRNTAGKEMAYLRVLVHSPESFDSHMNKHIVRMDVIIEIPEKEREYIKQVIRLKGLWTGEGDEEFTLCGWIASFQFLTIEQVQTIEKGAEPLDNAAPWIYCSDEGMIFGRRADASRMSGLFENDELALWLANQLYLINLPGHAATWRGQVQELRQESTRNDD